MCDLCHSWSHAACENLKDEQYDQLTKLTTQVENLSYYCNLNQCTVAHRKILHGCLSQVTQKRREANVIVYNLPELPNDKSQLTDLCNTVFGVKVTIIKSIRLSKQQDNQKVLP